MDKPLGPRLPDKRHEAYESIFGRPSIIHHQPNGYSHNYNSTLERRPSYPSQQLLTTSPQPYPPSYPQSHPLAHTRSITGHPQYPAFQPEEPPDVALDSQTRSTLTPAQAYQAQVYLNAPYADQGNRYQYSSPDRNSFLPSRNGKLPEPPRLGIAIDQIDGSLGIDFAGGSNGSASDHGTDDGSSELPWARKDYTCVSSFLFCCQPSRSNCVCTLLLHV